MSEKKIRPPVSTDPRVIDQYRTRDPLSGEVLADPDLDAVAVAMRATHEHAEQLAALADALGGDRTQTAESAALHLRTTALKTAERAAGSLDAARQRLTGVIAKIESETAAPPALTDARSLMMQGEVRAALARMSDKERAKAIDDAFKGGNDLVIGAVLGAPAMLTGMGPQLHEGVRHRFRRERHGPATERVERLKKALDALDRGGSAFMAFTTEISSTPTQRMAAQQADATKKATAALNPALAAE